MQVCAYAFSAVGSSERAESTDSRAGSTSDVVGHEVGTIDTTGQTSSSVVVNKGSRTLLYT